MYMCEIVLVSTFRLGKRVGDGGGSVGGGYADGDNDDNVTWHRKYYNQGWHPHQVRMYYCYHSFLIPIIYFDKSVRVSIFWFSYRMRN